MNRLWVAVALVAGGVGIMVGTVSAGGTPQQQPTLRRDLPRPELPATTVALQVTPASSAPVGRVVTMKVTMTNPPRFLLQGTAVVYQFEWREHAHNSTGNSGYHPATSWTFTPVRANLYALRVNWAVADASGAVRPGTGGSSAWYQLQVCAAGQASC